MGSANPSPFRRDHTKAPLWARLADLRLSVPVAGGYFVLVLDERGKRNLSWIQRFAIQFGTAYSWRCFAKPHRE